MATMLFTRIVLERTMRSIATMTVAIVLTLVCVRLQADVYGRVGRAAEGENVSSRRRGVQVRLRQAQCTRRRGLSQRLSGVTIVMVMISLPVLVWQVAPAIHRPMSYLRPTRAIMH